MRLSENEIQTIRGEVLQVDPGAQIFLFGSRVDDSARGGDIDVLVFSDKLGFRDLVSLRTRILDRIGWQQLDIVVRRHDQKMEPLASIARETGVKL